MREIQYTGFGSYRISIKLIKVGFVCYRRDLHNRRIRGTFVDRAGPLECCISMRSTKFLIRLQCLCSISFPSRTRERWRFFFALPSRFDRSESLGRSGHDSVSDKRDAVKFNGACMKLPAPGKNSLAPLRAKSYLKYFAYTIGR